MTMDIILTKLDDVWTHVRTCESIEKELSEYFKFRIPNWFWHPKVKAGVWSGYIYLFSPTTKQIYTGLVHRIQEFAKERSYSIQLDPNLNEERIRPTEDDLVEIISSWNLPFLPRDYQLESLKACILSDRRLILSPTGSGKSLLIYMLLRTYERVLAARKQKALIIVPSQNLCLQMYSDFKDYAVNDKWNADTYVHIIMEGRDKVSEKRIFVSTWQSIHKMPKKYFEQFGFVLVDECLSPNTKIMMHDGNEKEIKHIQIGDLVKTHSIDGKIENKPVTKIHKNLTKVGKILKITLTDGEQILITENHKIMTETGEWKIAGKLRPEDVIVAY